MGFMINLFAGCSLPVISKSKYTSFLQLRICCECCLNGHKNDVIWSRNFITTKGYLEDSSNPIKTRSETGNRLEKRHKLSKKVRKTIMSIERLYKPSTNTEVCPKPEITEDIDLPPADEADTAILESDGNYEHVQNLVKKIYKSATSHVYNDALWKRYVQQLQVIIPLLRPSDLCLVLYSFGKIK
ncbi:hypothetical protein BEWA_043100 [Theileria equi strain WA]|uniref:Uncharacterized protein n=1 Tax=Theileria equi strain WA TaxID=1537102 RepID=L1LG82_THEEQ|nr:hypothetical protein BEWA_043100 [Theileria equi strain WA]EKX74269.1 hypothetical protein BEWA_043100 [Theileria equi strain WA]|eukprot:XP_004833721.1 hypothetical protein BEWA_043100 [Theileria equi strain WA]